MRAGRKVKKLNKVEYQCINEYARIIKEMYDQKIYIKKVSDVCKSISKKYGCSYYEQEWYNRHLVNSIKQPVRFDNIHVLSQYLKHHGIEYNYFRLKTSISLKACFECKLYCKNNGISFAQSYKTLIENGRIPKDVSLNNMYKIRYGRNKNELII